LKSEKEKGTPMDIEGVDTDPGSLQYPVKQMNGRTEKPMNR
jgi:hypothetical protein